MIPTLTSIVTWPHECSPQAEANLILGLHTFIIRRHNTTNTRHASNETEYTTKAGYVTYRWHLLCLLKPFETVQAHQSKVNAVCSKQSSEARGQNFFIQMQIRRRVNNFPHYRYKLYFNKNRKLTITSFFNIVSLLFNALLPSLHKLLTPSEKKNIFGWAASHACTASFMRNTCATVFEFFYPFVDAPLRQNTVPVLCWKSSMDFGPWYTFRPQKIDHWTLLFLGANGKWSGHG